MLLVLKESLILAPLSRGQAQPQPCELGQETARVETSLCPASGNASSGIMFRVCSQDTGCGIARAGAAVWMLRTFLCVSQPSLVPGPCLSACAGLGPGDSIGQVFLDLGWME